MPTLRHCSVPNKEPGRPRQGVRGQYYISLRSCVDGTAFEWRDPTLWDVRVRAGGRRSTTWRRMDLAVRRQDNAHVQASPLKRQELNFPTIENYATSADAVAEDASAFSSPVLAAHRD